MKNLMKFTFTLVAFLFMSQMLTAQAVGQGAWMVGGSAGFQSLKYKDADESTTFIDLSPNLGYFIADDLAIGLALSLSSVSSDGESFTDFGLGPFVRFYFADAIFAQAGVNLGLGDNEFTEFQVGVGYSWFLSDGVAIEPMLFYNSHSVDGDTFDYSTFGLSIGVQAFANHDHGME
jgi:hypothetical protein